MEEIALINPARRPRRKNARKRNAPRRKSTNPRRKRRRNPELMLLNPKRRRSRNARRGRRRNPVHRVGGYRHRRNPGAMEDFLPKSILPQIAWGAGGALGTAMVSRLIMPGTTGAMGFIRDAASVLGIGWIAKQVGGREAQTAALVGGGTVLAVKLLNTMGVGKQWGLGLSEVAAENYNELGAYYEDPGLGAYYEEASLRAIENSDNELDDDELDDDELDDDELGDDELEDDELEDDEMEDDELEDDELGEDEGWAQPGMF